MWKPAIYMFKAVLSEHGGKGAPVIPKTLYYLAVCYGKTNNKAMESHYMNVLKTKYPKSGY